ncbi:hypothetical protein EYC84_005188 [Monilinia fructicola]|uniref:Uncharacterized protein n=1 Tax=Monilinia fructicola TaxID=38448 RepID=A0A5M9K436_MONFR|nr:hypothetical protein EYC84_005188 [Monilinia fructicola]
MPSKSYYRLSSTEVIKLKAEVVLCYNYRFRRQGVKSPQDSTVVGAPIGSYKNQDKPVLVAHTDQTREGGLHSYSLPPFGRKKLLSISMALGA